MPVIEPVPLTDIDPDLQTMIEKAGELGVPDPLFFQVMAHVPGYAEALFDAMHRSHAAGNVDHRLKEIIRVRLARQAGDEGYFGHLRSRKAEQDGLTEAMIEAGCGKFETDGRFTEAEKWALRYADLMFREPKRIDRVFYDQGKRHYTEAEIMELGAFIAFHFGMQLFFGTLRVQPT